MVATSSSAGFSSHHTGTDPWCDKSGCFPRFFLIGAQKAATTSLYSFLHDDGYVCGATIHEQMPKLLKEIAEKEPHFFDPTVFGEHHTPEKYRSLYPNGSCKTIAGAPSTAFMDATPRYMRSWLAPQRIFDFAPAR